MAPSVFSHPAVEPVLAPPQKRVLGMTYPWEHGDLLDILRCFPNERRTYWRGVESSRVLAGVGAGAVLTAHGADRFESIRQQAGELFESVQLAEGNPVSPILVGGFAYTDEANPDGAWEHFPSALFILPKLQWIQSKGQAWLTIYQPVAEADFVQAEQAIHEQHERILALCANKEGQSRQTRTEIQAESLMTAAEWNHMAGEAVRRIRRDDLNKVVLARGMKVQTSQPIDPIHALSRLDERYPECMRFLIEPAPGTAFLGATPETLVALDGKHLNTIALAGSAGRGASPEEDKALAEALMASPKEQNEHAFVVRSIRSRLAPLVEELHVDAQPGLWCLSTIQHLRTHIHGDLTDGCDLLDVIEALHPTPALGGTPRQEALALIEELEPISRGWYASPVGWFDASGDGEFGVAIRSAVTAGMEARLYAGAGIVADSDPAREWDETAIKLRPMLDALGGEG